MKNLNNKKVLFVSPRTFGYEVEIKKKLEEFGAIVDYFDERPANSTWVKAMIRINRKVIKKTIYNHYQTIIGANKFNKYDYIFFIHLETPFPDILDSLRKVNPTGKYILYMWDSILHMPKTYELTKYFDIVYSYDRLDAIKYNFRFRPLFFLNDYSNHNYTNQITYDLNFIGTIHSDRYYLLKTIEKLCYNINITTNWFMFIHNKLLFYKLKYSNIRNVKAHLKEFSFKPLSKSEVIQKLLEAKATVDIQHPENNGITMRTLEILGLQRKIITTNKDIINYDFYNPNNIYIIDRENPIIDKSFFEVDFEPVPNSISNKYTIDTWLEDIFGN